MRVVARVGGQGFYVEDVILAANEGTPPDCVEQRPQNGLYRPRWTGSAWEEGKPAAEILEAKKAEKIAELASAAKEELAPLFTEGRGEDEVMFLQAAAL